MHQYKYLLTFDLLIGQRLTRLLAVKLLHVPQPIFVVFLNLFKKSFLIPRNFVIISNK